jgi:hypothetical protein
LLTFICKIMVCHNLKPGIMSSVLSPQHSF